MESVFWRKMATQASDLYANGIMQIGKQSVANPNQYECTVQFKGFHINLQISPNGENAIKQSEVKQALDLAGYRLPNHRVRVILAELKKGGEISGDEISKEVFKEICRKEKLADNTQDWKTENRLSIVS